MHPYLDSGNLLSLLNKTFGKPWRQLPQLDRNRAAVGVNNDFTLLEIGDVGARQQMRRQSGVEQGLQALQTVCLCRQAGKGVSSCQVVH